MEHIFSRPGKPTYNSHIESFNGSFRYECLSTNWILILEDAKRKIQDLKVEYNTFNPHRCLGDLTLEMFMGNYLQELDFSNVEYSCKLEVLDFRCRQF